MPSLFPAFAAASTLAKCSGIRAWVSKLSMTLNIFAYSGVCVGRSVALPPQMISTSILSVHSFAASAFTTGTPSVRISTVSGDLLVKTAASSISGFCRMAHSTPRPRFPYPKIPILMLIFPFRSFLFHFCQHYFTPDSARSQVFSLKQSGNIMNRHINDQAQQ